MTLYPTINQITYWGVGDIDECSILAMYWAARAAGFEGELPSIAAFRAAAGVPDRPGPTGLTSAQVWRGIKGTSLRGVDAALLQSGTSWTEFATQLRLGGAASIAVNSALLPTAVRYGFLGGHSVGLTWVDGQFYIANPLAPDRSRPVAISETAIRAAALSFGGGSVKGLIFTGKGTQIALAGPVSPTAMLPWINTDAPHGAVAFQQQYSDARLTAEFYQSKHPTRGAT